MGDIGGLKRELYLRKSALSFLIVFLNLMILKRSKILGLVSLLLALGFTSVVVLGMLQVGPLEKYLYKDSVTLRGYYWNAGINMLRENLFSGVGIDRYGANFKLYRDPSFSLRQGYELNSTNAHNVFIQYFATGGLFLGIIYLVLILLMYFIHYQEVSQNLSYLYAF
jgi:O-antigen ligase